MSHMTSSHRFTQMLPRPEMESQSESEQPRQVMPEWPSSRLLVGSLVVVGLGLLFWYYLGPDLIRYMKMRNM